jgi:hypothetical protein
MNDIFLTLIEDFGFVPVGTYGCAIKHTVLTDKLLREIDRISKKLDDKLYTSKNSTLKFKEYNKEKFFKNKDKTIINLSLLITEADEK